MTYTLQLLRSQQYWQDVQNAELTGLAKNRFTDAETMLALAKQHYRLAKEYLAMNENITPEAAQELWDHRGYVFKAILLSKGSIKLKKEEYAEVYRKYFKNNNRSSWRMQQAFLGEVTITGNTDKDSEATHRPNSLKRFTPICRKRSVRAVTLWSGSSITRTARLTLRSESPRCLTRRRSNTTITVVSMIFARRL